MPLSARGSALDPVGGRFNIGNIDQTKFPIFSALYIAEDRETAYKEKYNLLTVGPTLGLTSEELSLTSKESTTIVSLNGNIKDVLTINPSHLLDFFNLIKKIKLPKSFVKRAKTLNINIKGVYPVENMQQLINSILDPGWRGSGMKVDIPSNSQILGQICFAAGIEAILYPSRTNGKKKCLAVFPENFNNSNSFIEIQGNIPKEINCKRLDSTTYSLLI